jgi:hypothetical protein
MTSYEQLYKKAKQKYLNLQNGGWHNNDMYTVVKISNLKEIKSVVKPIKIDFVNSLEDLN